VVVGGVFRGEIFSTEKVIILSTGLVLGAITAPRLIIEDGVIFNGSCKVTTAPAGEGSAAKAAPGNGQRAGAPPMPREAVAAGTPSAVAAPGQRR
jgi:cytoskeletal protein CcmA (bactofilin family)